MFTVDSICDILKLSLTLRSFIWVITYNEVELISDVNLRTKEIWEVATVTVAHFVIAAAHYTDVVASNPGDFKILIFLLRSFFYASLTNLWKV